MPNSQKGFAPILIILGFILASGLIVGGSIYLKQKVIKSGIQLQPIPQATTTQPTEFPSPSPMSASPIDVDEQITTVKPGQNLTLVDGETKIIFGHSGTSTAVPDIVFGKQYNLNDIHQINYLPIRKEVSFYNKGYFITLKNLGCKTETRFTDVPEVWVTECSIQITNRQEQSPLKSTASFSKELNTRTSYNASINSQADGLLIYVTMPRLSILHSSAKLSSVDVALESGSMTSYSEDTPWDIQIVSGYGIDTIRYTAQEVWNKENKEITIGLLKVKTIIRNLDCKVTYTGNDGNQTKTCDVLVDFSFSQENGKQIPIKIVSYQE